MADEGWITVCVCVCERERDEDIFMGPMKGFKDTCWGTFRGKPWKQVFV